MAKEITGLYSPKDVAEILNCSKSKALQIFGFFEAQGKLIRIGPRTIRIRKTDFHKWLNAQEGR